MPDLLAVDPDALRAAVPDLVAVAEVLDTALVRLRAALDEEGACWGRDEIGRAFDGGYEPVAGPARAAYGEVAGALRDLGGALLTIVESVQAADERARAGLLPRQRP
jgi:hypothetical protein